MPKFILPQTAEITTEYESIPGHFMSPSSPQYRETVSPGKKKTIPGWRQHFKDTGVVITNKPTNQAAGLDQMIAAGLMSKINEETHRVSDFHLTSSGGRVESWIGKALFFT